MLSLVRLSKLSFKILKENVEFNSFHYEVAILRNQSTRINSDILYTIGHIIVKRENYGTHSLSKESHVPHKLLTNFGPKFVYLVIRLNNLLFFNYTFVWRSFICDVSSVCLNNSIILWLDFIFNAWFWWTYLWTKSQQIIPCSCEMHNDDP